MTIEQNINELLARLSACTSFVDYAPLRSRCVQALDSYEYGVGVGPNRAGQWARFERIDAEKRAMFSAMSVDELCPRPVNLLDAVTAHRSLTASQAMITDLICADVYGARSLPTREGSEQMGVA